jgi:ribonuclease D
MCGIERDFLSSSSSFTYVQSAAGLAQLTDALSGASRVGLDTEADSLHHYFEKVCLIQLSFSGANYIVDPLAGFPLTEFLEVLSQKELIIQGADYDLRMMKKSFEFRPKAPVFDTMLAAQVLGYEKIGLAALAEKFCGVLLSKSGQKSDWARRPLSEKQLAYAADDTRYIEAIADAQTEGLKALGRLDWHRECCERVVVTSGISTKIDADEAWRIKGSSKLAPKVQAFVRELWKWRDEAARQRDRPPFMILLNEDLIRLAAWRAEHPGELLRQGPPFLKRISGEPFERLEKAILTAESLAPSEWPVSPKWVRSSERQPSSEKVEALLDACKKIAAELKIESCFLASRAVLTAVARHEPRSVEKAQALCGMMRWQAELIMPAIQAVLGA